MNVAIKIYGLNNISIFKEVSNRKFTLPLLSNKVKIHSVLADTRIYDGVLHGHMVVELPNEQREANKIITWLVNNDVKWKEEI